MSRPSPSDQETLFVSASSEDALDVGLGHGKQAADIPSFWHQGGLGSYKPIRSLGRGGMGEVVLAEDSKLGRRIAVKVLPPETASRPSRLARFDREARALATLNHPNIVTIHSIEKHDDLRLLTMEWIRGKTLREALLEDGFDDEELLRLAVPLADAVAAAHEQGVTHRDLKPANIMIDERGHLKILDFGIAKLCRPDTGHGHQADDATDLTRDGQILGTLPYMAPEQVEGGPIDGRTDVFSLGLLLFEMSSGRRPLDPERAADALRQQGPSRLAEILDRCLRYAPAERYANAGLLRDDLEAWRRELRDRRILERSVLDAGASAVLEPGHRRIGVVVSLIAGLAILVGLLTALSSSRPRPEQSPAAASTTTPVTEPAAKTSLAVLAIENLGQDPGLDWLSGAITAMLVTDLSQSSELKVLSASRMTRWLDDLNVATGTPLSLDQTRQLAAHAAVEAVVRGGFARMGDQLRIQYTIESAESGEILRAGGQVDGLQDHLFTMVDEISAAIRNAFEVTTSTESPVSVEAVTTSSMAAWRLYSEGMDLAYRSKDDEAVALLEKAVEIDPGFSLALTSLGRLEDSRGNTTLARRYTHRAVEQAGRLPADQRYEIEGFYFATRWSTYGQAIAALEKALELYPDRDPVRANLALYYSDRERYDDAIREYRRLLSRGETYPGTIASAANAHAAMDRFETGYQLLREGLERDPDDYWLRMSLGWFLTDWGQLEEARQAFDQAEKLRAGETNTLLGQLRLATLRESWPEARRLAVQLTAGGDAYAHWQGTVFEARLALFRGEGARALERLAAVALGAESATFAALSHCWQAEIWLLLGDAEKALAETALARAEATDDFPEVRALFLAALAQEQLGKTATADQLAGELRAKWRRSPNPIEQRQLLRLTGLLALSRGDASRAVEALRQAVDLLPARGVATHWHVYPDHVVLWTDLGRAELAAGRPHEAQQWLTRATEAGSERLEHPVAFVLSFFYLGRALTAVGDHDAARASFQRFLHYWDDGDLDPAKLEEARHAAGKGAP